MPKNSVILLIRHAEKPPLDSNSGLSSFGEARAQAYVAYFQNYVWEANILKFAFLFASADSNSSDRPLLTLTPLSKAIKIAINDKHSDHDYGKLAKDIIQHSKYDNNNILICWHHGKILDLAYALGVNPGILPSTSNWPKTWPDYIFGWVLQIQFDDHGQIIPPATFCINQKLMYDDDQNPPS